MARSEGKPWLSSHVLSQLMQARVRSSSGFGKLVVSAFPARLPNRGGGRISKIDNAALFTRKQVVNFRLAPVSGSRQGAQDSAYTGTQSVRC
jgi:hypothetical protein